VLQSLDTLGAGFQLASHDLDIRGAGNLLGEEQSGHIREVGYELYQQMLEEAVASLKAGGEATDEGRWSPQITIGMAVMIPEAYVADLQLRLGLYKRLADLDDQPAIDAFAAELIDRFGPLPEEVEHLLEIVADQGALPPRQCREGRRRTEGRRHRLPRQHLRQSGRADRLDRRATV
jgi:transcription-repair coupling factor (superfamily II helicase)